MEEEKGKELKRSGGQGGVAFEQGFRVLRGLWVLLDPEEWSAACYDPFGLWTDNDRKNTQSLGKAISHSPNKINMNSKRSMYPTVGCGT